jgi:hypothetical protein
MTQLILVLCEHAQVPGVFTIQTDSCPICMWCGDWCANHEMRAVLYSSEEEFRAALRGVSDEQ